jgi:hypothetical protein
MGIIVDGIMSGDCRRLELGKREICWMWTVGVRDCTIGKICIFSVLSEHLLRTF